MSLLRRDAKRDISEPEIVAALKSIGMTVYRINQPLDLIVGWDDQTYLVECKTGKTKMNPKQVEFVRDWKGGYTILRNADEALVWGLDIRKGEK